MGQLIKVEAISASKTENFSEKAAKIKVGTKDMIAAVSKALLGDIFVRIFVSFKKLERSLNSI